MSDYAPGAILCPHLSPFVEEGENDYIPPERVQQLEEKEEAEEVIEDEEEGSELQGKYTIVPPPKFFGGLCEFTT